MTVKISGGSVLFRNFLKRCGNITLLEFDSMQQALQDISACDVCIFLPENGNCIETLNFQNMTRLGELKKSGVKIYLENYMSVGAYQGRIVCYEIETSLTPIVSEVLTCCGSLLDYFGEKAIFQARQHRYLPANSVIPSANRPGYEPQDAEVLMRLGRHIGVVNTQDDTDKDRPILFRSEGLYASLISFSNFDGITMLPYYRYRKFFGYLFANLLSVDQVIVEAAFISTYQKLKTQMSPEDTLEAYNRTSCYENAVKKAVQWHFDSNIIQENYSVELITSSGGWLNESHRVDAGMYTGWLVYEAGCHFGDTTWKETGKTIFDYYADQSQITEGAFKGLFKWFLYSYGPTDLYTIDCGRCGISLVNMYRLTGEEKYLSQIRLLADGFLNWFHENGFMRGPQLCYYNDPNLDKFNDDYYSRTPAVSGEVGIFLVMASKLFSDSKYSQACATLADRLCGIFPDFSYYGHTTSIRYARFLMLLAAVQDSGLADHSDMINRLLDYLQNIQLNNGAVYVEDNLSYAKYGSSGFGGENGVNAPWEDEKISDQLYGISNLLMALSSLTQAKHTENVHMDQAREMLQKVLDYITRIQISHPNKKYNGGWMRAFDVTRWEYYGLNVEALWGPYCIMAGWTMGILPLELLSAVTDSSHYIVKQEEKLC